LAKNGNWHFTRMNLNTFDRHGVFSDDKTVKLVVKRLADKAQIQKARVFPMQIMAAHSNATDVPRAIQNALHDAMEAAVDNVPEFKGKKIFVAVDSSGSMSAPATGFRKGASSVVSCKEAAALFAASIIRKNDEAEVIQFTTEANMVKGLNPRDSILTTRQKIGNINGGTDVSSPLRLLNKQNATGDLVIILSDMESWADPYTNYYGSATGLQAEWDKFCRRNPKAQLVCVNLVHGATAQATKRADVLNVGGFSDQVFTVVEGFVQSHGDPDFWVSKIKDSVDLTE
jgi:60 kDa SS-A/Ro ribonucleoprotein